MTDVLMVCNNCGTIDSGPDGAMYECRACGWGDGWGAEDRADAERRSATVKERGRLDGEPEWRPALQAALREEFGQ